MQEVSVNSTTIKVYPPRKNDHPLFWKNPVEDHNDLLDLLKDRITAQVEFDAKVSRICINQKEVMQPLHPELRSGSISFLRDTSRYSHPESGTCGC